jgi:hypothetical protein
VCRFLFLAAVRRRSTCSTEFPLAIRILNGCCTSAKLPHYTSARKYARSYSHLLPCADLFSSLQYVATSHLRHSILVLASRTRDSCSTLAMLLHCISARKYARSSSHLLSCTDLCVDLFLAAVGGHAQHLQHLISARFSHSRSPMHLFGQFMCIDNATALRIDQQVLAAPRTCSCAPTCALTCAPHCSTSPRRT